MTARHRVRRAAGAALAVTTLLLAAALIWAALDIWAAGRALRQTEPAAVIFSPGAVRARLPVLLPVFCLWLIAWVTALATGSPARRSASRCPLRAAGEWTPAPRLRILRTLLLGLALFLLILGVLSGGLREVFGKAANLCTECIGLG